MHDRLLACAIDGGKVQDPITLFENEVAEHGIDTCCGVGNEDEGFDGRFEYCRNSDAGLIKELGVVVKDELVWAGFRSVLESAECVPDWARVGAEGS